MAYHLAAIPQVPGAYRVISSSVVRGSSSQGDDGPEISPVGSNEQGATRKSVKYLTCWYWQNGGCKKSEHECLYSHHDTGIQADRPRPVRPGGPVVAGKNALMYDGQEKTVHALGYLDLDSPPSHQSAITPQSIKFEQTEMDFSPGSLPRSRDEGQIIRAPPGLSNSLRRPRPSQDYGSPLRTAEEASKSLDLADAFSGFRDIMSPPLAIHPNKRMRNESENCLAIGMGPPPRRSVTNPEGPPGLPPFYGRVDAELGCVTAAAATLGDAVQKHLDELWKIREEIARFQVPLGEFDHPMYRLQANLNGCFIKLHDRLTSAKRELQGATRYDAVFPPVNSPWSDHFRYRTR